MAPKGLSEDKETSQNMKLVLATLSIPPKENPKDTKVSAIAASTQLPKDSKEKLIIKMKK